ncbi:helix-turn-helix transcriptional regulator [Amycolatopsis sp. K13G38]|uniref:Helix-turn-helix transcriptional regulator n=1 Tax=Amycolatopsis acididurans TaxID=2724524 RepID=A0ABX1JFD1_9PSEU|nr:helix-turn-helix transcriptional regulator [Amycolatopsis acididurans]NKQ57440.1 helix-turn-helix transcriptional regulator [Amycolatopsis acididurans]
MPRPSSPSPASTELGRRVHEARKAVKGLTQEKLAHKLDIAHSGISDIERGLANPTFETLVRIADALNTDPGDFIRGFTAKELDRS